MTIIGIDLETSNSAAAVLRGGRPVMIPSAEGITLGGKAFPSYVAVTADGQMPARLSRHLQCPLWVRSGHLAPWAFMSAFGVIADIGCLLFES